MPVSLWIQRLPRVLGFLTALPFALGQVNPALSQPASITGNYSSYEREAITATERALGAAMDPSPEGKAIEAVVIIALDPIEPRDPLPVEVNALHSSTHRFVIERELLLRAGRPYRKILADESARRLRALPQLSLVVCFAIQGSTKETTRLVVITKDVWSLYVDFDVGAFNSHSGYLLLEPKETNLFGTHQSALARFRLDPSTQVFGAGYRVPRAFGRKLWVLTDANAIFNRDTDRIEGSYATFEVVQPLLTSWQSWAWFGAATYRHDTARSFDRNGEVSMDELRARNEWRRRESSVQLAVTRSFGWAYKQDFSVAASVAQRRYSPTHADEPISANQPRDDLRAAVGIEWHSYTSNFLRTFNLDTLGLQEDYRLGHDIIVAAYPSVGTLEGANRVFLSVDLSLQETVRLGTGFFRAFASWRADTEITSSSDAELSFGSYLASPQLGFGRLIQANAFSDRYANRRNLKYGMGGTGRLRGYDTFWGSRMVASNLEYRTPALAFLQLQWGAVAFYDVGMAFDDWGSVAPKQSLGFGLRLVVPQVERKGFRLDFGFPVHPESGLAFGSDFNVYFSFGQAFGSMPIRGISPPIAL